MVEIGSLTGPMKRDEYNKQMSALGQRNLHSRILETLPLPGVETADKVATAGAVVGATALTAAGVVAAVATAPITIPVGALATGAAAATVVLTLPGCPAGPQPTPQNSIAADDISSKQALFNNNVELLASSGPFYVGEKPRLQRIYGVGFNYYPVIGNVQILPGIQEANIRPDHVPNIKFGFVGLEGEVTDKVPVDPETKSVYYGAVPGMTYMPDGEGFYPATNVQWADPTRPEYKPNPLVGTGEIGDPKKYIVCSDESQYPQWYVKFNTVRLNYNNDGSERQVVTIAVNENFSNLRKGTITGILENGYQSVIQLVAVSSTGPNSTPSQMLGSKYDATGPVLTSTPVPLQLPGATFEETLALMSKQMEPAPVGFPEITTVPTDDVPAEVVEGTTLPRLFKLAEYDQSAPNGFTGSKTGVIAVSPAGSGSMDLDIMERWAIPAYGVAVVPGPREGDTEVIESLKSTDVPVESNSSTLKVDVSKMYKPDSLMVKILDSVLADKN
ncbi:MAG: hypothetical protein WC527_01400 [Candidatus Margulisiibacteriota bacterium]